LLSLSLQADHHHAHGHDDDGNCVSDPAAHSHGHGAPLTQEQHEAKELMADPSAAASAPAKTTPEVTPPGPATGFAESASTGDDPVRPARPPPPATSLPKQRWQRSAL